MNKQTHDEILQLINQTPYLTERIFKSIKNNKIESFFEYQNKFKDDIVVDELIHLVNSRQLLIPLFKLYYEYLILTWTIHPTMKYSSKSMFMIFQKHINDDTPLECLEVVYEFFNGIEYDVYTSLIWHAYLGYCFYYQPLAKWANLKIGSYGLAHQIKNIPNTPYTRFGFMIWLNQLEYTAGECLNIISKQCGSTKWQRIVEFVLEFINEWSIYQCRQFALIFKLYRNADFQCSLYIDKIINKRKIDIFSSIPVISLVSYFP